MVTWFGLVHVIVSLVGGYIMMVSTVIDNPRLSNDQNAIFIAMTERTQSHGWTGFYYFRGGIRGGRGTGGYHRAAGFARSRTRCGGSLFPAMTTGILPTLAAQRCHFHAGLEAVARCPECKRFFCRECITEHDDRLICAGCLQKLSVKKHSVRKRFAGLGGVLACAAGIVIAWFFFYSMGRLLLMTPTRFHEGTVWETPAGNE